MNEEGKKYSLKLTDWKAYYHDREFSSEKGHQWKDIPRDGMIMLQRFFQIIDENGEVYTKDGHDTFYEFVHGHSLIALSSDSLRSCKRLPKEIKFMAEVSVEKIKEMKKKIEGKYGKTTKKTSSRKRPVGRSRRSNKS